MRVWRLAQAKYPALDGEGARRYGGRWNSEGHAVVYTASHLSLAALELLVHVASDIPPPGYEAVEIEIPDGIIPDTLCPLPEGWYEMIPPIECKDVGDRWIESGQSLICAVPSAVVPEEYNYLLNPAHADMRLVTIIRRRPFSFDPRLVPASAIAKATQEVATPTKSPRTTKRR